MSVTKLTVDDLQKGVVFWWEGSHRTSVRMHTWSCPAMVLERTEKTIVLLSLDDYLAETTRQLPLHHHSDDPNEGESFSTIDPETIKEYVNNRIKQIHSEINGKKLAIRALQTEERDIKIYRLKFLKRMPS